MDEHLATIENLSIRSQTNQVCTVRSASRLETAAHKPCMGNPRSIKPRMDSVWVTNDEIHDELSTNPVDAARSGTAPDAFTP